jgi:hypothetical protein
MPPTEAAGLQVLEMEGLITYLIFMGIVVVTMTVFFAYPGNPGIEPLKPQRADSRQRDTVRDYWDYFLVCSMGAVLLAFIFLSIYR